MFKEGRKVKHSNRNNSAADCSISIKFSIEFHQVTGDTLQMFKVKGQGQRVISQGHNVT